MLPKARERGFTLIELLVVIAIIAVFAAILFSVFNLVKNRSQHTACAVNLRNLGTAYVLYANDHDGWVPPATTEEFIYLHVPGTTPTELAASPGLLRLAMKPYVKSDAVWYCPTDPQAYMNTLWLGMRHRHTSYRFFTHNPGQLMRWPPSMQVGRDAPTNKPENAEDTPLISDAMGLPSMDSDPQFKNNTKADSNHPDTMVNAIRHDLSLSRRSAREWMGSDQ